MHTLNVYASAYATAVARGFNRHDADASAWLTVAAYRVNEIKRSIARAPRITFIEWGGAPDSIHFSTEHTA